MSPSPTLSPSSSSWGSSTSRTQTRLVTLALLSLTGSDRLGCGYARTGEITEVAESQLSRRAESTKSSPMQIGLGDILRIDGISEAARAFCEEGATPSAQGLAWGRVGAARSVGVGELGGLEGAITQLQQQGAQQPGKL